MTPIHVLVADHEPALRRSLARVLEARGMRVGVVEDGLQALDYVAKTPPDVALVDVTMPGLGGLELLARLQAGGAPCEVILMTACVDVESAVAAMKAGAHGFLTKPLHSNDAVVHAVEKAAEKRRLVDRTHRLEEVLAAAAPPPSVPAVHDPTRGMLADLARLPYTEAKRRLLSLFDETYTAEVLRGTGGNMSEAARRAGLDRSNFRRLLKRHKDEP